MYPPYEHLRRIGYTNRTGYSNGSAKIEFYIRCKILSCHFILDGDPAGLISSVSLFGCLRMQGRLIFSVSSTDVEIEKIKIIVSVAPNSQIPDRRNPNFKDRKPHFEIWHRKKPTPRLPDRRNPSFEKENQKLKIETKFWKVRGDGGAQSDSANPAGLISFVSFSTHSVSTIYCPREFVSCTARG